MTKQKLMVGFQRQPHCWNSKGECYILRMIAFVDEAKERVPVLKELDLNLRGWCRLRLACTPCKYRQTRLMGNQRSQEIFGDESVQTGIRN